jgi:hypothetical protein
MLRPALASAACAAALLLAACGGNDDEPQTATVPPKPAYCDDLQAVRDAAAGLTDLKLDATIGTQITERLDALQASIGEARESGKDEFAQETAAIDAAVEQVKDDVANVTTGGLSRLPQNLLEMTGAVEDLVAAIRTRCDEPSATTTTS